MVKTILLLIAGLIVVPVAAWYLDTPLTAAQTEILWPLIWICLGVALYCFVVGELTRNCSQVDKLWSIVPLAYAWYTAVAGGMTPRLILMAVMVSLWGIRLTYNFSRRGAYSWKFWSGEEDYRWEVLRQTPALAGRTRWFFFNLFFICLYQNGLILLFSLPILKAVGTETPLGWLDYIAAALMLSFLVLETVADQQQWNYQTEKWRQIRAGQQPQGIYARGFVHTGLWAWVRHPNYLAEQATWVCFYLFSVAATGQIFNFTAAGFILLLLLFQGSSDFSEKISAGKYPDYAAYQKKTGRFLPKLF